MSITRANTVRGVGLCLFLWTAFQPRIIAGQDKHCAKPALIQDDRYKPGQVWSYKTRESETRSTVTILRVESLPKIGTVVHVRIDGIQFANCTGGPSPNLIEHAPFTKEAIDRSVVKILEISTSLPPFEEGYREWLSHCGGVYTLAIADVIRVDDKTFSAGLGCSA